MMIDILSKEKYRFFFCGFINFIITNIVQQIALFFLVIPLATLVSQMFNVFIGYTLYRKFVFLVKNKLKSNIIKYIFLAFLTWNINTIGIYFLVTLGINLNISAILFIPSLTLFSYYLQKNLIFNKSG